jgi:hypothetical protein
MTLFMPLLCRVLRAFARLGFFPTYLSRLYYIDSPNVPLPLPLEINRINRSEPCGCPGGPTPLPFGAAKTRGGRRGEKRGGAERSGAERRGEE